MSNRSSCDHCLSKDNLITWDYKGNTFGKCMTPSCKLNKAFIKTKDVVTKYENYSDELWTGEYKEFRGISINTCTILNILHKNQCIVFNYNNSQKIRTEDKKMFWVRYNSSPGLFGDKLSYDYNKPIIITEGELDAASCIEVGYQAYSIALGASNSTKNEIFNNLSELIKFKEIILWMDQDSAGQIALNSILSLEDLPLEKIKIINNNSFKDANECLYHVDPIDNLFKIYKNVLINVIESAREYIPPGITIPSQELLLEPEKVRIPTPFAELNKKVIGISQNQGELWVLLADPKIGKSTFTKKWAKDLIDSSNMKVGVAYLEEPIKTAALSFITADNEVPLVDYQQNSSLIDRESFEKSYNTYIASGKLIFINLPFQKVSNISLFSKLKFLIKKGYKFLILDHITMLTYDMDEGENERKTIDSLMKKLRALVNDLGATILVISHVKRPNTWKSKKDAGPEARVVESTEARGSGVFEQVCDVMLALERNINHDSESVRNQLKIKVLLNRITGQTGYADTLYWITNKGIITTLESVFKCGG